MQFLAQFMRQKYLTLLKRLQQQTGMTKLLYAFLFISLSISGFSQITITTDDMPMPGDSYLISTTNEFGLDYESTGENYTWDFSTLQPNVQDTVNILSISDVPTLYLFFFNNPFDPQHQSNVVQELVNTDLVDGVGIENALGFAKSNSSFLEITGVGAEISGIQAPITFEDNQLIYSFPLEYGSTDQDTWEFSISAEGQGYFGQQGNLTYEVDGYGELIIPLGTFDVLRVKRTFVQYDTAYNAATQIGFGVNRVITRYEWVGLESGLSLLEIETEFGLVNRVTYQDVPFISNLPEQAAFENMVIYPQPALDIITIDLGKQPSQKVLVAIYDLSGKLRGEWIYEPARTIHLLPDLQTGMYLLEVKSGRQNRIQKLILN
jgi:hypothetical protein